MFLLIRVVTLKIIKIIYKYNLETWQQIFS